MSRRRVLAMGWVVGMLLAGCATVEIWERRVVTGVVKDASGEAVANSPVVLVGRYLDLRTLSMKYVERGTRSETRASTDALGRYRFDFIPGNLGNDFHLFFYDRIGFDRIKYRPSEPLDITTRLKGSQTVTVDHALQFQLTWPEVQREIEFFGSGSDRAKVLRKHGLPERREISGTGDPPSEVWWYYTEGRSFRFVQNSLEETQEFRPIPAPPPPK